MEKLKIVINGNEYIANQAKEFFSKLGYHISSQNRNNAYGWSLGDGIGDYYGNKKSFDADPAKEITIQQLRDMVVLKRNDVNDATHIWHTTYYFVDYVENIYSFQNGEWRLIGESTPDMLKEIKPIRKEKQMKEWIYKDGSGEYLLTTDPEVDNLAADAVEVPGGANVYARCNIFGDYKFLPKIIDGEWSILWQRQPNNETATILQGKNGDYLLDSVEQLKVKEMVNHPEHYNKHPSGIECIDIVRHHDFAIGNAIKYLWRAGLKDSDNEVQDLEKAIFYIKDKIKQLKAKSVDDKTIDWIDESEK